MFSHYSRICLLALAMCLSVSQSNAQMVIIDAIKLAAKKVIRAIDLQVQRIQNKTIDLQNAQKQLENVLSKLRLDEIADWTNRQKELYQAYFDELWKVKSLLLYYRQVSDLVNQQKQLWDEYQRSYQLIARDTHFSPTERQYIWGVYGNILEKSMDNMDHFLQLMQSFTYQMSDEDRLTWIHTTQTALDEQLTALRQFNERNKLLSLQRAKNTAEIEVIKQLYGF
jgi:hypothetical protein